MNPILAGVAIAVVAGAVIAVSSRDARMVVLALAGTLVLSPLLADPFAAPAGLAARLVGSILGTYLLWMAVRERPMENEVTAAIQATVQTGGSRIGWPAEVLVGAAAGVVGFAAHGLGAPGLGPELGSAAGFAVAALAVTPLLSGRDVLRLGTGLFLLLDAALVIRVALGGTPDPLEHLVTSGLVVALGGTLAALAAAARTDGQGGLELAAESGPGRRREQDARPLDPAGLPPR
ncbi:MAG: hypothetical protein ABIP77_06435 [Candidatus Limnocylindrales bacterium]